MLDYESRWTVARQFTSDGVKRYLVWLTRCGSTAVFRVEAENGEAAKTKARLELEHAERVFNTI